MAKRLVFIACESDEPAVFKEEIVEFEYFPGFAISQKQKSIKALHESILKLHPNLQILEISTKSELALGSSLSAFNLKYKDSESGKEYSLENVFQSSKKYKWGGPYLDMLSLSPADAKRDTRHHTSGELIGFKLNDWDCPLEPKTMFYDWIYCKSLSQNPMLVKKLLQEGYNAFTDIEFNHEKSINCQARSVAIFVGLSKRGLLEEYLDNKEKWETIYRDPKEEPLTEQLTFDFGL